MKMVHSGHFRCLNSQYHQILPPSPLKTAPKIVNEIHFKSHLNSIIVDIGYRTILLRYTFMKIRGAALNIVLNQ